MEISRSQTNAPGYGELTLVDAELEDVKSLRIIGATFNSMLAFEMHLREVVSKAARNLEVGRRAGKLIDCPRELKDCFNAYVVQFGVLWLRVDVVGGVLFEFAW